MAGFLFGASVSLVAALLLASGVGHLLRHGEFRTLVRQHGIVPAFLSSAVAALVTAFELITGTAVLAVLAVPGAQLPPSPLLAASAAAGLAFVVYLRRLLQHPPRALSCGCSPLAGPLTPLSLVPAATLALGSVVALAASSLGGADVLAPRAEWATLLASGWGVTLALLVLLLPAVTAPRVVVERQP